MSQTQFETQIQEQIKKKRIYRQGDVILEQVDISQHELELYGRLVSDIIEIRSENGHSHIMNNVKLYRYHNRQIVVVENPTPLVHEQHPTIVIEPSVYQIRFVRDWLLRESRPVD
jgi:hypothetical protein